MLAQRPGGCVERILLDGRSVVTPRLPAGVAVGAVVVVVRGLRAALVAAGRADDEGTLQHALDLGQLRESCIFAAPTANTAIGWIRDANIPVGEPHGAAHERAALSRRTSPIQRL